MLMNIHSGKKISSFLYHMTFWNLSNMIAVKENKRISNKPPFKEKVVQIYEKLFLGQDITEGRKSFWDEFFLLKVNVKCLHNHFEKLNVDELVCLKPHINRLFSKCIEALGMVHPFRVANAIQTITCVVIGVLNCRRGGGSSFDLIHIMMGIENAATLMQDLITACSKILSGDHPYRLRCLVLNLLLSIGSANGIINENPLMEYLIVENIFDSITNTLSNFQLRKNHGKDACHFLALLMQFRKFESDNPYRLKFSVLDDELILHGFSFVISLSLAEYNNQYRLKTAEPQGFLSSLSNAIGNVLVGAEKTVEHVKTQDALLLGLYEAVHVNRHFITTLTHTHTHSGLSNCVFPSGGGGGGLSLTPTGGGGETGGSPSPGLSGADDGSASPAGTPTGGEPMPEPTNLLVVFLEYCSIVMQDIKDPDRLNSSRLCFLILICISEDQYASSLLHDVHLSFKVHLHKMPMRHRKLNHDRSAQSRPLVCALLDLLVEFLQCHLMKHLPIDLFTLCLNVIHRLLCYQKRNKLRLEYEWKQLWTALFNLVRFILSIEQNMTKACHSLGILYKAVTIFNLFITFGDAFLPTPSCYDELYYEVIRMHHLFESLYSLAMRHSVSHNESREKAAKLANQLENIRGIINHFTPKIDAWAVTNNQSALTEEEVLTLVRSNYDTLTLKLQDDLDNFERYNENTNTEQFFFAFLVRSIVANLQRECMETSIEMQHHMHELSTIP